MEKSKVNSNTGAQFSEKIDNGIKIFLDQALSILHNEFNIIHDRLKKEKQDENMFWFNERALLSIFCNACMRDRKVEDVQIIQELSVYNRDRERADALILFKENIPYQLIVEAKAYKDEGSKYDQKEFAEYVEMTNKQAQKYIKPLEEYYELNNLYLLTIHFNYINSYTKGIERFNDYKLPKDDKLHYYHLLKTNLNKEAALEIYGTVISTK
jgi:hypothetical protein